MIFTTAAKAWVGALIAGLTALIAASNDSVISTVDWITIVTASVVAFGAIYGVPNTPSVSDGDGVTPVQDDPDVVAPDPVTNGGAPDVYVPDPTDTDVTPPEPIVPDEEPAVQDG